MGPVEFSKGDQVKFRLMAANETDEFTVGISGNGTITKVKSTDGIISYTFTIEEDGSYELLMQSWKSVSLTGTITIP